MRCTTAYILIRASLQRTLQGEFIVHCRQKYQKSGCVSERNGFVRRPDAGWGQKGELNLSFIASLAQQQANI